MLRGHVVLGDLAVEFGRSRNRFDERARRTRALEERHARLLDEEREALEALARVYVPELSPPVVSGAIAELRERLEQALQRQRERRALLEGELPGAAERTTRREARVEELAREVERVDRQLESDRARVEAALDADPEHVARVTEHRAVMERREHLKTRRARLGAAATAERPRYEADRLFTYLLERRFGEPEYGGGFLIARLDAWLARHIGFETLLRHYRILTLGPHQIQAEIRRLGERASRLEPEIDRREEEVARREGLLGRMKERAELEGLLEESREDLERTRETEERLRAEYRELELRRGAEHAEVIGLHREYLAGRSDADLWSLARSTPGTEDDDLVRRLEEVRRELDGLERQLEVGVEGLRREARRAERLGELRRAGIDRFTSPRSVFPDDFRIHPVLDAFMAGDVGPAEVVDRLRTAHVDAPVMMEVERPYFDALYRQLAAAFDIELAAGSVSESDFELDGDVQSEVVVHDSRGRVIARRLTHRSMEEAEEAGARAEAETED